MADHTVIALVQDKPGVLNRVASMFRRRGFNIESLAVGASEQKGFSRMTFVVSGDEYTVEQVTKQLNRLIDVMKVSVLSDQAIIARELALIKVKANRESRNEIIQIVNIFRANIIDVGPNSLIIEVTGEEEKIEALCELLAPFGIKELMRTGRIAILRGTDHKRRINTAPAGNGKNADKTPEQGYPESSIL